MWDDVLEKLKKYRKHTIYIGVSGGIDSMALLYFLFSNQFKIHVLHVNYHKRGEASDLDMKLVAEFCEKHSIPCTIRHFEKGEKGNFQENARKFRYQFFEEFASNSTDCIALAHHADDQVETFFMNLMRQSGMVGLASMPSIREKYIRPFLALSKSDLLEYATKNKIEWREDASNQSADCLRNKWRIEFIPLIEKSLPQIKEAVLTLVDAFQETQKELENKVKSLSEKIEQTKQLTIEAYQSLSSFELFELWRQMHQPSSLFARFQEIDSLSKGKYIEVHFPYSRIVHEGDYFSFISMENDTSLPVLLTKSVNKIPKDFSKSVIYLNPKKIRGELKIRKWEQGDRISSVGVNGSQLISKVIKDSKIPHHKREQVLVVHDDVNIHWVVGLKVGALALSQKNDDEMWEIQLLNTIS